MHIPIPLFKKGVCHNDAVAVQVVGDAEALGSIGDIPTLDGTITWSFRRPNDPLDPEAMFTFVIWHSSLTLPLSCLLQDCRCDTPVVILYGGAELPPLMLNGRKSSRLRFGGPARDALLRMISSLIVPVAFDGWIGVDHADVKLAIEHGGVMRDFECRSQDFRYATDAVLREVHNHLASLGANSAVCVGLQVSSAVTMGEFDAYMKNVLDAMHPDTFAVISCVTHDNPQTIASILTLSG